MATQTIADFIKNNPGYTAGWDKNTKKSTITDSTGKSITFDSGMANDTYGITGQMQNGSNVIDADKLKSYFNPQSTQPTQSAQPQWDNTQYSTNTNSNYIDNLKQAQISANAAALDKQKSSALSNLESERAKIAPQAYKDRNAANVVMNNTNRAWDEFLAAKGLTSSGIAGTGFIATQNKYQGEIGAINQAATARQADIDRQATDVNNTYESDLAAAKAGAEATALQNLINQRNTDRTFDYQQYRDSMGDYQWNKGYDQNQQQINTQNSQWQQQFDNQLKQQELDNLYRQKTFDYQVSRDTVADTQWQKAFNLDMRKQTFAEAQQKIENALAQKRINQESASQALQWAKFNADQDQQSIDNQNKAYNNYLGIGLDMKNAGSEYQGTFTRRYDDTYILNWIKGLDLPSAQKAKLANDLGL